MCGVHGNPWPRQIGGRAVGSVARSVLQRAVAPVIALGPSADNPGWSPRPRSWRNRSRCRESWRAAMAATERCTRRPGPRHCTPERSSEWRKASRVGGRRSRGWLAGHPRHAPTLHPGRRQDPPRQRAAHEPLVELDALRDGTCGFTTSLMPHPSGEEFADRLRLPAAPSRHRHCLRCRALARSRRRDRSPTSTTPSRRCWTTSASAPRSGRCRTERSTRPWLRATRSTACPWRRRIPDRGAPTWSSAASWSRCSRHARCAGAGPNRTRARTTAMRSRNDVTSSRIAKVSRCSSAFA